MYNGLKDRLNDLSEFFTRHDMPMSAMTLTEAIKAIENESDAIQIKDHQIKRLQELIESQQMTIEAAVGDITPMCSICKFENEQFGNNGQDLCVICSNNNNFEWRGVQNG